MSPLDDIRPSPIAGTWYPRDITRLSRQLDDMLAGVQPRPVTGRVMGLIVPHAGYQYSGLTAAHGFAMVRGMQPDLVVIFSPFHDYHPAQIISSGHVSYLTPLGQVGVNLDVLARFETRLLAEEGFKIERVLNDREHSLEIELPFLQRALAGEFQLLPLMIRSRNLAITETIGRLLAPLLDPERTLLIASTDLSHFYPEKVAHRLDQEMLKRMAGFSPRDVLAAEEEGVGYACGAGAVAAMLSTARYLGANAVEILHYSTSGEVTGDHSQVVGYGSAAVLRQA